MNKHADAPDSERKYVEHKTKKKKKKTENKLVQMQSSECIRCS